MPTYKLHPSGSIINVTDGTSFLAETSEALYRAYLVDVAGGSTVLPADPPVVIYAGRDDLEYRVETVGTAPQELLRLSLTTLTVYSAFVLLEAIDAGNGVVKSWYFKSDFKRLNNGAQAVGARQDIVPATADGGAPGTTAGVSNWAITPSLSGNDAVISVVGHTGRTVDWFAFLTLRKFRPGGGA